VGATPRRVACLVGDGAFQMTAQELSTAVRDCLPITYFVLNNYGYGIERLIHEGPKHNDYNDVQSWDFAALARVFGMRGPHGLSRAVSTEAELAATLAELDLPQHARACNLVEVRLARDDFSAALKRLGESIKAHNKLS
jgi:indolepyruvate decarboxylase